MKYVVMISRTLLNSVPTPRPPMPAKADKQFGGGDEALCIVKFIDSRDELISAMEDAVLEFRSGSLVRRADRPKLDTTGMGSFGLNAMSNMLAAAACIHHGQGFAQWNDPSEEADYEITVRDLHHTSKKFYTDKLREAGTVTLETKIVGVEDRGTINAVARATSRCDIPDAPYRG